MNTDQLISVPETLHQEMSAGSTSNLPSEHRDQRRVPAGTLFRQQLLLEHIKEQNEKGEQVTFAVMKDGIKTCNDSGLHERMSPKELEQALNALEKAGKICIFHGPRDHIFSCDMLVVVSALAPTWTWKSSVQGLRQTGEDRSDTVQSPVDDCPKSNMETPITL